MTRNDKKNDKNRPILNTVSANTCANERAERKSEIRNPKHEIRHPGVLAGAWSPTSFRKQIQNPNYQNSKQKISHRFYRLRSERSEESDFFVDKIENRFLIVCVSKDAYLWGLYVLSEKMGLVILGRFAGGAARWGLSFSGGKHHERRPGKSALYGPDSSRVAR